VSYRFDAGRQIVVLDRLGDAGNAASGVLCARHASAMVLPKGWWLDDRRVARPSLFAGGRPSFEPSPAAAPRTRRARRPRAVQPVPEPLPLEPEVNETVIAGPDVEVEEAPVGVWNADFNVRDDLDGLLRAESPLLSRAFGGRARRGKRAPSE
jgi:hypothetical protein